MGGGGLSDGELHAPLLIIISFSVAFLGGSTGSRGLEFQVTCVRTLGRFVVNLRTGRAGLFVCLAGGFRGIHSRAILVVCIERKIKHTAVFEISPRRPLPPFNRTLANLREPVIQADDSARHTFRCQLRHRYCAATGQQQPGQ